MSERKTDRLGVASFVLAALLTAGMAVAADEVTTSGSATIGAQDVSNADDSSKYQEYREVPDGPFLGRLDFSLNWQDWYLDLQTADILQQDQRVTLTMGRPGTYRVKIGYDQNPKWFSNTSSTLFSNESGGRSVLSLPMRQELQSLPATGVTVGSRLKTYLSAAQDFDNLRFRRDTTLAEFDWTPRETWSFDVSVQQEERDGTQPKSASSYFGVGGDVAEFPALTDYTTRTGSVSAEYTRPRFSVGAAIDLTTFTNETSAIAGNTPYENAYVIDNPLRAVSGTPSVADPNAPNNRAGALWLVSGPPDSTAAWVHLNGSVKVGSWANLTLLYSMGRNEQDEAFLPFSLNTAVPPPVGTPLAVLEGKLGTGSPVSEYNGEVDLTRYDIRFTGRPIKWFRFSVYAHSYDYDNKTEEYTVTDYIRADTDLEGIARAALPFAWKKDNLGADFKFRPLRRLSLTAGVERESWERKFRNAPNTDEDILKLGADWTIASWGSVRASWRHGDREFDDYDEDTYFGEESFPEGEPVANAIVEEQRLFDLANRVQDRYDLMARVSPFEWLDVGLQLSRTENGYEETELGRTEDTTSGWALDAAVDIKERVTLSGNYARDRFEYLLASRYRPVVANVAIDDPLNNWFSEMEDRTISYGLDVTADLVPEKLVLDVRGSVTDSRGIIRSEFVPGGAAQGEATDFPDVLDRLTLVSAELRWIIRKGLSYGFAAIHEGWHRSDFARDPMRTWMGAVDAGAAESVYLGQRVPNYDVTVLRILVNYKY